jgi:hypothetical protein
MSAVVSTIKSASGLAQIRSVRFNIDNMSIFEALVRDGGPLSSINVFFKGEKFSSLIDWMALAAG